METPPSPYMHGQSVFDQVTPLSNEEVDLLFSDPEEYNDSTIEADDLDLVTGDQCSITLTPALVKGVTKVTYIMLPQSAPLDAVKLTARILAMSEAEMSIQSRLFTMILRSDISMLMDMHRLILLASKEILYTLAQYLNRPILDESEWSQLRNGSLGGFAALKDDTIYEYTLLCPPRFTDQPPLNHGLDLFRRPYTNFPPVKTHVTPFALTFHALRVLECTTFPMTFDFEHVFRARTLREMNHIEDSLERALLGITKDDEKPSVMPQEMQDHIEAFMNFVLAFDRRCAVVRAIMNQTPPQ